MRRALVVLACLVCLACEHTAVMAVTAGNGVTVELLFEYEGIRVYRFRDSGDYHYYAVPLNGRSASTFSTESCGKNCTEPMEVETVGR